MTEPAVSVEVVYVVQAPWWEDEIVFETAAEALEYARRESDARLSIPRRVTRRETREEVIG